MTSPVEADELTVASMTGSVLKNAAAKASAIVWLALVVFTIASFVLGGEHVIDNAKLAAAVVIVIAAVKIRLVGIHFMELRHAPLGLRLVFEIYCVLLVVVLMGIYLFV